MVDWARASDGNNTGKKKEENKSRKRRPAVITLGVTHTAKGFSIGKRRQERLLEQRRGGKERERDGRKEFEDSARRTEFILSHFDIQRTPSPPPAPLSKTRAGFSFGFAISGDIYATR